MRHTSILLTSVISTLIAPLSMSAHAGGSKKLEVRCEQLGGGFAGPSATLTGNLKLTQHPLYPAPAKKAQGKLVIQVLGSTQKPYLKPIKVSLEGQYDQVGDQEYVLLGGEIKKTHEDVTVYIDLKQKDISYVEIGSEHFATNCVE